MNIFILVTFYYTLTFATSSIIIILAVMLLGIYVSPDERLNNFRLAKKYLSLSYFILGVSGFISLFSESGAQSEALSASCTLIIASYQALLFTYTILVLTQPLYIKRKIIFIQLGLITTAGVLLFLTLLFTPHLLYNIVFYISVSAYFFQISYYTYIFRINYNACLHSLEEYYEDDEHVRLRWVNFYFYSALAVGVFALMSLFFNIYFSMFFSVLYTAYYSYIVCRFYNYQIEFKFAIPVINQNKIINKETNKDLIQCDSQYLIEKCEQFKNVLDEWVEKKKFTQKDISVDEIAESLNINRSFLQYYFRTHMQTDFRTWRSELRIREAQFILKENPKMPLGEIHELVGFNHRANFHQQFQKITAMTPTEYRQEYFKKS